MTPVLKVNGPILFCAIAVLTEIKLSSSPTAFYYQAQSIHESNLGAGGSIIDPLEQHLEQLSLLNVSDNVTLNCSIKMSP